LLRSRGSPGKQRKGGENKPDSLERCSASANGVQGDSPASTESLNSHHLPMRHADVPQALVPPQGALAASPARRSSGSTARLDRRALWQSPHAAATARVGHRLPFQRGSAQAAGSWDHRHTNSPDCKAFALGAHTQIPRRRAKQTPAPGRTCASRATLSHDRSNSSQMPFTNATPHTTRLTRAAHHERTSRLNTSVVKTALTVIPFSPASVGRAQSRSCARPRLKNSLAGDGRTC